MIKFCKKWWFYITIPLLICGALLLIDGKKDLKNYEDYIFYGIAQNKVTSRNLKVNFSVRGFPHRRHSVYVEVVYPDGTIDFVSSEEHTAIHRAHYDKDDKIKAYKAQYKLPKLPAGKYRLRVRFEFDTPGWGRLNRDVIISNDIAFEVK